MKSMTMHQPQQASREKIVVRLGFVDPASGSATTEDRGAFGLMDKVYFYRERNV
jgi:hypothetical protein